MGIKLIVNTSRTKMRRFITSRGLKFWNSFQIEAMKEKKNLMGLNKDFDTFINTII